MFLPLSVVNATRLALIATLAATACAAQAGEPVAFPTKPIKIVVPFGPGGAVDVAARLLGKHMSATFNQQVVVENKPGAGELIGVRHVIGSPADGHTLLLGAAGGITINPILNKDAGYDPEKALTAVSIIVRAPNVLVVSSDFPASSVAELIAYAKKHPGELTYSSSGVGTIQHVTGAVFNEVAGIDVRHVPYSGAPQATLDVATKRVTMTYASPASIKPFVARGELKTLAVVMSERYPMLPDLPTVKESPGMGGYDVESWFGLFAPGGTPPAVVQKLNAEVQRIMQLPEVTKTLTETAGMPARTTPEQAQQFVHDEIAKYRQVLKTANVVLE